MIPEVLQKFKPEAKGVKNNNILCIVEGKTELKYILSIFRKYIKIRCKELVENFVIVRWGKAIPKIQNYCEFQGGSKKGSPTPLPALEAFEFEKDNLDNYFAIIIMFDSDKDDDRRVEKILAKLLKQIDVQYVLLVSNPCFESTLIDYCKCGNCRNIIDSMPNGNYPCDKYKNNFSKLPCFCGVDNLIENISKYSTSNHLLLKIDEIIMTLII
jgi:hypothetical protein